MLHPSEHSPHAAAKSTGPDPVSTTSGEAEQHELEGSSAKPPRSPRASRRWVSVVLGLLAPFVCLLLAFGMDRLAHRHRVLRGVWVADVALSGASRSQAERALRALQERLTRRSVRVRIGERLLVLEPRRAGLQLDVERTLDAAFQQGRSGSLGQQLAWWWSSWSEPVVASPRALVDAAQLRRALVELEEAAFVDPASQGGVLVRADRIEPIYPRPGYELHLDAAAERVRARWLAARAGEVLDLPLRQVNPRLSRAQIDAAVAEAERWVSGPILLYRSESAVVLRFSEEELRAALASRVQGTETPRLQLYFDPELVQRKLTASKELLDLAPRDASFLVDARDRLTVVPSLPGLRLVAEHVAEALAYAAVTEIRRAELPVSVGEPPKLDTRAALGLGIRGLVAKFTTYHPCCQPRVQNIHRIADLMDGVIVLPGETFSVNAWVGPRTAKAGFVPAPTIEEGEMVDSLGGGISQFATTLFNAVFHGGYDIVERQPHTYYFSRYPMGHEATLSYPKPDLIFRNDTAAGLLIKTHYTDTSITVKLYGDNGGRTVRAQVSTPQDVVQPRVEYEADPELLPEEEKVKDAGQAGWTVIVARILSFADGTSKQEQRKVVYRPKPRRVRVHPCVIPDGEPGHTGDPCPVPDASAEDAGAPLEQAEPVADERETEVDAHRE